MNFHAGALPDAESVEPIRVRALFLSDLHLGTRGCQAQKLLDFLRDYDAAVICSGLIGFGLGPTPTAIANMTALTQRYGASPVAFLVVPLVGAFFGDLLNFAVIHLFLLVV